MLIGSGALICIKQCSCTCTSRPRVHRVCPEQGLIRMQESSCQYSLTLPKPETIALLQQSMPLMIVCRAAAVISTDKEDLVKRVQEITGAVLCALPCLVYYGLSCVQAGLYI